jgi:hypothetical protein
VGSSCAADSDCGGPTSEWPHCNHGGTPTSSGEPPRDNASSDEDDGDEQSTPPTPGKDPAGPTKKDAGSAAGAKDAGKAPITVDAGTAVPSTPNTGGESGPADSADAGVPDGGKPVDDGGMRGVDGGLDGGVPRDGGNGFDGGAPHDAGRPTGSSCTNDSDGRDAGACFGIYCTASADQLASNLSSAGACLASADLALVCDGELARVVDDCAQDNALALGFGSSVRSCARAADSLDKASPGCIDCYVDERLCSVENCLTVCLAGRAMACTECRATRCGAAFAACSGLPRPSALTR